VKHRKRDIFWLLVRRLLQVGVFIFIAASAAGGIWRNYKVAHNSSRLVSLMEGEGWGDAYLLGEHAFGLYGESYRTSFDFLGAPWSATIFGLSTADPILVLANFVSTGAFYLTLIPAVAITVLLAVFLGKVFCSHLCPMRFTFELGQLVRAGLLRLKIPLPYMHVETRLGGWVLLGGLLATLSVGTGVWFLLLPYLGLSASIILGITAGAVGGLIAFPLGWLMVDVLFAPGFFCHNVCPTGFILEQLGRFSFLKVRKTPTACPKNCQVCSLTCPYALSPREETHAPACDNCGACVRACPEKKLSRRFSLPVIMGLALLLLPSMAWAHHNKGLPHYGYYENYPQVPEIGATVFNFQGLDRTLADTPNDIKIFVYVYDLELDTNYTGKIDFDITHEGEVISTFTRESIDEELIYRGHLDLHA
jgi:ferredoxin-type protein NapH